MTTKRRRTSGPHVESEDHPWSINVDGHPQRSESKEFRAAKTLAKKITATMSGPPFYGGHDIQMHHGGSLFLFDDDGWLLARNEAGIEWSAQFCADPTKVDRLRLNARRLCTAFPKTTGEMARLGYPNAQQLLDHPIKTATDIAHWVDSIFNACVPIPAPRHIGVLPKGGGLHHYPTPITDIELIKHDDFILWVTDPKSHTTVAVTPVAPRGAGVNKTAIVFAEPGTRLHARVEHARAVGKAVWTGPRNPLTRAAYIHQNMGGTSPARSTSP
jgi:hypothetical protein